MNFAKRPPRNTQNRNSQNAVISVIAGMTATASGLARAMPICGSSVPTSAAGAASTPKTKRGEVVSRP